MSEDFVRTVETKYGIEEAWVSMPEEDYYFRINSNRWVFFTGGFLFAMILVASILGVGWISGVN